MERKEVLALLYYQSGTLAPLCLFFMAKRISLKGNSNVTVLLFPTRLIGALYLGVGTGILYWRRL
jgi:hypothetical protein